ncbi:MAG: cation-transporting P-type ATPase, partial [Candidatus Binataceae bacterium]
MNPLLSVTPNAVASQPAGERSTKGAAEHVAPGTSDLALLPLPELLQFLHSTDTGLSAPDAASILKAVGPNRIESAKRKSLLTAFI